MDFILGIPDIAKYYVQLLTSMLKAEATRVGCVLERDMRQEVILNSGVTGRSKSPLRSWEPLCR